MPRSNQEKCCVVEEKYLKNALIGEAFIGRCWMKRALVRFGNWQYRLTAPKARSKMRCKLIEKKYSESAGETAEVSFCGCHVRFLFAAADVCPGVLMLDLEHELAWTAATIPGTDLCSISLGRYSRCFLQIG
jgi:hypothetical protein